MQNKQDITVFPLGAGSACVMLIARLQPCCTSLGVASRYAGLKAGVHACSEAQETQMSAFSLTVCMSGDMLLARRRLSLLRAGAGKLLYPVYFASLKVDLPDTDGQPVVEFYIYTDKKNVRDFAAGFLQTLPPQ